MILYHFTGAENLDGITERGLVPAIGKHTQTEVLTLGMPVVWFTSNRAPLWMVAPSDDTDMCMLTVDLRRKHLRHWRTWLTNIENDGVDENGKPCHFVGAEILAILDKRFGSNRLTDTSNYWICTRIIRPQHIVECQRVNERKD
jgi:hypothetical protein